MPGKKYYFWRQGRQKKILWPSVILLVCTAIIVFRLVQLQLLKGSYYLDRADRNRLHYSYITAPRGEIFDRRGVNIAGNRPNYSLYISLEGLTPSQSEETARTLEELTGRSRDRTLARLASLDDRRRSSAILFKHLSREEIIAIEENHHRLGRVFIQANPIRKYPFSRALAHFTGYVGEISSPQLRRLRKYGYRLKDIIGKTGIEREYDMHLKGRDGYRKLEVSVDGKRRRVLEEVQPRIGNHLLTTIDSSLQQRALEAMGDKSGAVVAMDPRSGEILVWLSTPGFDPEEFTVALAPERARDMFADPFNPLFDRIIKGQFSPGSVLKLVVALAALEEDPAAWETEYTCRGSIRIGYDRQLFRCWEEEGHGRIPMKEAIAKSCNVYFYLTGLEVGAEKILQTARKLGLGQKAQEIMRGENTGFVPSVRWKRETTGEIWYPGDTANLSIGQGYTLLTPIQLLRLTSAIAAGGVSPPPYAVKMVISPEGEKLKEFAPASAEKIDVPGEDIRLIRRAMRSAVEYGTGASMRYYGVNAQVAGKTGTAENPFGDDHGWFAAFAPYQDPEIAVVVLVEHGGTGAASALPVAAAVLREKFRGGPG